jgi:hypothetical protein
MCIGPSLPRRDFVDDGVEDERIKADTDGAEATESG